MKLTLIHKTIALYIKFNLFNVKKIFKLFFY
jgi:hypothetical protein